MLHQFQILDILLCNTYCRLKEIIRQESCYGCCECVDSQNGSVVSSMSGWPCHSDAASVCPSVCRSGAVKREPSGGGNDTWTAGLEQAEEARIHQLMKKKKKGNLLDVVLVIFYLTWATFSFSKIHAGLKLWIKSIRAKKKRKKTKHNSTESPFQDNTHRAAGNKNCLKPKNYYH